MSSSSDIKESKMTLFAQIFGQVLWIDLEISIANNGIIGTDGTEEIVASGSSYIYIK